MNRYPMSTMMEELLWGDSANNDDKNRHKNNTNHNGNSTNQQPFTNASSESGSSRSGTPLNTRITSVATPNIGTFHLNNNNNKNNVNFGANFNANFNANYSANYNNPDPTASSLNQNININGHNNMTSSSNSNNNHNNNESSENQYRQFVTTLLDSSTNKLVQLTSQPPPDYVAVKKRRNRISISCMSCKRRKVKCDRDRPICGSCKKHGYTVCVYSVNENENDLNKIRKQDTIQCSNQQNTLNQITLPTNINSTNSANSSTTIAINNNNHNNEYQQQIEDNCQYSEFNTLLNALDKIKVTHVNNEEINQLKKKIEHLRFYLDDKSILKSKILKDLNSIETFNLVPILKTNSNVSIDSFNLQFGASSITSYVEVDNFMGTIFKKSLPKIESDILKWRSFFSVDIYKNALEKLILSENFEIFDDSVNLNDIKRIKFKFICKLLEDYFINFEIFNNLMTNSIKIMHVAVPVVPIKLIKMLIKEHFISDDNGNLKIINNNSIEEFSEILLILTVLRFGLPKSENVIITPDEINYKTLLDKENILTDNKTDLLNSFLKIILNETDLTQTYNIPMLGTLIIFFMISYTHRFNFKSDNTKTGLNYGILAVYLAVHLGFYANDLPKQNVDNNEPTDKYLKEFSIDDFHNVWNLIMFVDTFSSFNSGIPQLISSNMDTIYITNFVDLNCANICHFYRKTFKLANNNINSNNDGVSIIQYERFVIEFESFIVHKLEPTSVCILKNDLVGVATSIRALNLLLFLYYNSYFSFLETIECYKKNNKNSNNKNNENNNVKILKEFDVFKERLFQRCIQLSIVSLIDLNIILVKLFSEKHESFYEKYSFDLIQIFTRIIYTLTSCICRMISPNNPKPNPKDFNFLFDISNKQSEDLSKFFVAKQCSDLKEGEVGSDITKLLESVDELSNNPSAMIKLLVGFFFNTSRSLISQDFIYYALYKYFVMAVIQFSEHPCKAEDFDIDRFELKFSHVDCTWFINKG